MLICPRCDMEYDQGETTCGACGSPLVVQEDPNAESTQAAPGKRELRKCPRCNMLYEKRTHCLSCGTALVALDSSPVPSPVQPAMEQPEKPREDTVGPNVRSSLKTVNETGGSPKRREDGPVTQDLPHDKTEAPRPIREPQVRKRPSEKELQQIVEGVYPQASQGKSIIPKPLLVGAILLVVLAFGYFSVKRAMVSVPAPASAAPSITAPIPASVTLSSPEPEVRTEEQEATRIKGLLENIRQANLREDIDLFLSCYAADFKGLEKKKRATLESWEDSDYLDLSYNLKSRALAEDTAKIQVEWIIRTAQSATGQLQEGQFLLEALLKKEGDHWKIKAIKTLS
jgi:hypothetical protein